MQNREYFPLNGIQRLLEVGLIIFSGFGLFILLALLSFDPADPSWSQTGYQTSIHNYAGPIGAWLADLLLFSFGWIAYLIPFLVALAGYLLFKRFHDVMSLDYLILGLRLIGLVFILFGLLMFLLLLLKQTAGGNFIKAVSRDQLLELLLHTRFGLGRLMFFPLLLYQSLNLRLLTVGQIQ